MRQLIQHRLKTNVVGRTGHVQPLGKYVKKIIPTQTVTILDLDGDGLPDTILSGTQGTGGLLVTEDADSINIDIDGDGVIDFEIPK